jgi:molybdopterin-guanine dinucleotide biosynthesis protein B
LHDENEPSLAELLAKMDPVDVVLIEGFKRENHPKIEIFRGANGKLPLYPGDPTIVAIAADVDFDGLAIPRLHLDDIAGIADIVQTYAAPADSIDWDRGDQGT